jgi:hypothetical protein
VPRVAHTPIFSRQLVRDQHFEEDQGDAKRKVGKYDGKRLEGC